MKTTRAMGGLPLAILLLAPGIARADEIVVQATGITCAEGEASPDALAIQSAIDGASPGDVIVLIPGPDPENESFFMCGWQEIRGAHSPPGVRAAVIVKTPDITIRGRGAVIGRSEDRRGDTAFFTVRAADVHFEDLDVRGARTGFGFGRFGPRGVVSKCIGTAMGAAIVSDTSEGLIVEDCAISSSFRGIVAILASDLRVEECEITATSDGIIAIASDVTVEGGQISAFGDGNEPPIVSAGIFAADSDVNVAGAEIHSDDFGIRAFDHSDVTVEDCLIEDCLTGDNGDIQVDSTSEVTVRE